MVIFSKSQSVSYLFGVNCLKNNKTDKHIFGINVTDSMRGQDHWRT